LSASETTARATATAAAVTVMMTWLSNSQCRLAPLPVSYDCSPWLAGSSGDGALASVALESTFMQLIHRIGRPGRET
jgi:hypothetical protein